METIHGLNKNGPAIIGTGVAFAVLSVTAVGLRFLSKRMTSASYGVDDWLLLASLIIFFVAEVLVIESDVIGRKALSPEDHRYILYQQYVYVYSVFYFVIVALTQMSLVFFYRRLFYPSHLRYTSLALAFVSAACCVAASVIEIGYPGHPIAALFPGSSTVKFNVTYLSFWLAMGIIETLIDIVIMVLPIRELQRLKLSTKQKVSISLIFSLGGFVVITGIVRMATLYRPGIGEFDFTIGDIWFNCHLGTAIISACLPTFRPLISKEYRQGRETFKYPSDDTRTLTQENKKFRGSRSQQTVDEIDLSLQPDRHGNFFNARRSESNDTTRRQWSEEGAIRARAAIGVKQTIEVV